MIPAIAALVEATEELERWCDYHQQQVATPLLPSALVLTVDPRSRPMTTARLCGNAPALVQALLVAARGNEALRRALIGALPELLGLAE